MINIELPVLNVSVPKQNEDKAMFGSVHCKILQSGIGPVSSLYHLCSCDAERVHLICEECFLKCHQSKGHVSIKNSVCNAVCICGIKYHQPLNDQRHSDLFYQKKCLFGEWSIESKLNFLYSFPEVGKICLFCYNICLEDREKCQKVSVNSKEQAICNCKNPNHEDIRILFRKLISLSKNNNFVEKYQFPKLTFIHFANLLTLATESYNNIFHSLDKGISNQNYSEENEHSMIDLHLSSNVISKFALKCKGNLHYFTEKFKNLINPELFSAAIEGKFNDPIIWKLRHNMSNIFWMFSISRDFTGYPKYKIRDVEILSPLQRLMMLSNIKNDSSMIEYTDRTKFSLLNSTLQMIQTVNNSKDKTDDAYFIMHRLYQICQVFAKFSLFNNHQLVRLCTLNDEVLEKFHESSQDKTCSEEAFNAKVKVLSPMVKTILYLAYYFNDQHLQAYLKGVKNLDTVSFFHWEDSIGMMVSRNAVNIQTVVRIHEEESKVNDQTRILNKNIKKCLSQIMENTNNIISLAIANPECYSAGLIRIFNKNQELYLRYTDNVFSLEEESFVDNIQYQTKRIENLFVEFYSHFNQDKIDTLVTQIQKVLKEFIMDWNIEDKNNLVQIISNTDRLVKDQEGKNVNYVTIDSTRVALFAKDKTQTEISAGNAKEIHDNYNKFRILFNKSNFISSMIKIIYVLHNYHSFTPQPQATFSIDGSLLNNLSKILHFYIKDNPDNSVTLLMSNFTSAVEVLSCHDIFPILEVIQNALQNILKVQYDLTSSKNILHLIKVIARKSANSPENLSVLDKIFKIIQIIIRIHFVKQQIVERKLKKILREVYEMNPIFQNYLRYSCLRQTNDIDSGEQDLDAKFLRSYSHERMEKSIKKFLRIINHLFKEDAALHEIDFLKNILRLEEVPKILKRKNIKLPLRTEILKFYRIVYIDVIMNPSKIANYRSLIINDPVLSSQADSIDKVEYYQFNEEMIAISESNLVQYMDQACAVLTFELKFFSEIIEENKSTKSHKKLEYTEQGIIVPLCVYMSKFSNLLVLLNGYDYLRLYDLVYYFLHLKKYVITNIEKFKMKEALKIKKLFKCKMSTEMYQLINKDFSDEDIIQLDKDLTEMDTPRFEILNFSTVSGIFKKHIDSFISSPKFKGLKNLFEKKPYVYSNEEIIKRHERLRKAGMLTTQFEEKAFNVIMKYINMKNKLDQSAFIQMLEEDNIHFNKKYRYLLVKNTLYFMSCPKWMDKYKDLFRGILFRLLQYDTISTQKVIYELHKTESGLLDFQNVLNVFTTNLISLFLKSSSPTKVLYKTNYFDAIMLIKFLKYLCEEHNRNFQKLIFKEEKVQYLQNCQINSVGKDTETNEDGGIERHIENINKMKSHRDKEEIHEHEVKISINCGNTVTIFEYMVSILRKIILISKWDFSKHEKEINEYYYDIFFVIIEFIIETIQGTDQANFEAVFGKAKTRNLNLEKERNIFGSFLWSIKKVILDGNPYSHVMHKIRQDLINLVMAFLEEKSTPSTVVNEISSIIMPHSVMKKIVETMIILFQKLNPRIKFNKTGKNEFTQEMNKYFCESYFKVPNFPHHEEFLLANRMYQYFKLLGTERRFMNDQAYSFFEKMKEVKKKAMKKRSQIAIANGPAVAFIDTVFYQSYWCAKFFEKITRTAFIHNETKEDEQIRVLFTLNPLIPVLSKHTQLDFLKKVDRSNRYVKLISLMENCDYFYNEIIYNQSKARQSFILKKIQEVDFYILEVSGFIITLVMNLMIISSLEGKGEVQFGDPLTIFVLMGLGLCNVILNTLFIILWIYAKFSLVHRIESDKLLMYKKTEKNEKSDRLSFWERLYLLFMVLIWRNELTTFIWHIVFSSISISNPEFYFVCSIQLFIVLNLSETLRNIIRSLTLRYQQLIATTLFVFIACYIFSCIAFFFLSEDFIVTIQEKPPVAFPEQFIENECGTLLYCFVTHLDYGLRTDGGIGEHLPRRSFTKYPSYYVGRFFYNLFYFVLVVVILLSIVFGVVIDAFAELRDKIQSEEFDRKNICFICGAKRDQLEKNGIKFDKHTKKEHNIWTYAEYIIGLKFIDKQETNAINSYVMEEVEKNQIGWIPAQAGEEEAGEKHMGE